MYIYVQYYIYFLTVAFGQQIAPLCQQQTLIEYWVYIHEQLLNKFKTRDLEHSKFIIKIYDFPTKPTRQFLKYDLQIYNITLIFPWFLRNILLAFWASQRLNAFLYTFNQFQKIVHLYFLHFQTLPNIYFSRQNHSVPPDLILSRKLPEVEKVCELVSNVRR